MRRFNVTIDLFESGLQIELERCVKFSPIIGQLLEKKCSLFIDRKNTAHVGYLWRQELITTSVSTNPNPQCSEFILYQVKDGTNSSTSTAAGCRRPRSAYLGGGNGLLRIE